MGAHIVKPGGGGSGRRRRRGGAKPMSEINVTPFVDVMLVLLIIFMVSAPLLTVGVPVELPKSAASALAADSEEPLTVTLTAEGGIMIQTILRQCHHHHPRLTGVTIRNLVFHGFNHCLLGKFVFSLLHFIHTDSRFDDFSLLPQDPCQIG